MELIGVILGQSQIRFSIEIDLAVYASADFIWNNHSLARDVPYVVCAHASEILSKDTFTRATICNYL